MTDLSYKKMVVEKMGHQPDPQTLRTLDVTEDFIEKARKAHPEKVEEFLVKLAGSLSDCHFDKDTSCWIIGRMRPVGLVHDGVAVKDGLKAYLDSIGLTPEQAHAHVRKAWDAARMKARSMGFEAPAIPSMYNMYDMYVTMAMIYADYWVMDLTPEKAAMMAYAYLADPDYDSKVNKIWDYLMD